LHDGEREALDVYHRRFLHRHYPDHLAPIHPYAEEVSTRVLQLQTDIIYAPINSRRLGRSYDVSRQQNFTQAIQFPTISRRPPRWMTDLTSQPVRL
jgi:hypothetical protein